jgi:hypothetical protein
MLPPWLEVPRVESELIWPSCGERGTGAKWHANVTTLTQRILPLALPSDARRLHRWITRACERRLNNNQMRQLDLLSALGERDANCQNR